MMKGLESPRGNLDQDDSRPTTQEDFKNELKISNIKHEIELKMNDSEKELKVCNTDTNQTPKDEAR